MLEVCNTKLAGLLKLIHSTKGDQATMGSEWKKEQNHSLTIKEQRFLFTLIMGEISKLFVKM